MYATGRREHATGRRAHGGKRRGQRPQRSGWPAAAPSSPRTRRQPPAAPRCPPLPQPRLAGWQTHFLVRRKVLRGVFGVGMRVGRKDPLSIFIPSFHHISHQKKRSFNELVRDGPPRGIFMPITELGSAQVGTGSVSLPLCGGHTDLQEGTVLNCMTHSTWPRMARRVAALTLGSLRQNV